MHNSDLILLTWQDKRFGIVIARTIRVIAKLLYDWCCEQEKNFYREKGYYPNKRSHLTAIYFDKLAEFYCRLWDQLHVNDKVRDMSGLRSRRGFHGPGRTISINRQKEEDSLGSDPDDSRRHRMAYTTEIVEKLKSSFGNDRILFELKKYEAWDYRCQIHPTIDQTQWDSWILSAGSRNPLFLTTDELSYVDEISMFLCFLDRKEVRALGTHHTCDETIKNIRFNIGGWKHHFDKVVLLMKDNICDVGKSVENIVITANEIVRKSGKNRSSYKSARKKILDNVRSQDIEDAFQALHETDSDIWDNNLIKDFYEFAIQLYNFSIYCRRCLFEFDLLPRKLENREIKESDAVFNELQKYLTERYHININGYSQNFSLSKCAERFEKIKMLLFQTAPPLENREGLNVD